MEPKLKCQLQILMSKFKFKHQLITSSLNYQLRLQTSNFSFNFDSSEHTDEDDKVGKEVTYKRDIFYMRVLVWPESSIGVTQ